MSAEFDFDQAVFCYYMKNGEPVTVKELSEYAGVSVTRIRKIINSNGYSSSNTLVEKPVRERNCNTIKCYRRVDAYQPTLRQMRSAILEIRHKANLHAE